MGIDIKEELALQAKGEKSIQEDGKTIKLDTSMTIPDMVKAMMPEIKKALPAVITPERFTRIALSALNNTPALQKCTPMSFLAALMNAAQLGLEPNTPLGQAYLIPYKNKGILECQFQIGYKGLIDLAYRNGQMQTIQAQSVCENDHFEYEYGLDPKLIHRPAFSDRGEPVYFYGIFKTVNGGFGFSVMSKSDMDQYARNYSKAFDSGYSPWKSNYEDMAKKTVIKQALKYAPIKTDFQRALSSDESIKKSLSDDMFSVQNEVIDMAA
ncbi:MAG: recombinase RecT [Firmicutes bacterium]|nr:recombinase RecT [Bacillota bacterium]